jgi:hypothetical protein
LGSGGLKSPTLTSRILEMVANGNDWRLAGTLPEQVVKTTSAASNYSPSICKATRSHRQESALVPPRKGNNAQGNSGA